MAHIVRVVTFELIYRGEDMDGSIEEFKAGLSPLEVAALGSLVYDEVEGAPDALPTE